MSKDHKTPGFPAAQHSTPPVRDYRVEGERTVLPARPLGDTLYTHYSNGEPLPDSWVVRYHATDQRFSAYRDNRLNFRAPTRGEADRRIQYTTRSEFLKATVGAEAQDEFAPDQEVQDRYSGADRRERTRTNLWFAVAGIAGLLVGGISVGLVATNQAPDAPVTPESCIAAVDYAEQLIEGYGDGLRGSMLSQPLAKSDALNEANDKVQRLTPLYQAEAGKCRVQK